jgi:sulfopyruvate decarboxylase subunit beta
VTMMKRDQCFRILARHVKEEIVVAAYSSAHAWNAINDRPLNYYSFGAMGLASSHALGLALGLPHRRIVVLDGDGSLLMNLGSLVTIAAAAPKNLIHFVCQNRSYEANGGHPLPNPDVDFAGVARSAGIRACHTYSDLSAFEADIGGLLQAEGPVFAVLKIEEGPPYKTDYANLYAPARREALRAALASAR